MSDKDDDILGSLGEFDVFKERDKLSDLADTALTVVDEILDHTTFRLDETSDISCRLIGETSIYQDELEAIRELALHVKGSL
ncbi:hypothetical protein LCGC14_0146600 [marine sediment metagenome]|uniref:Uncharacterized protein n=1 Tax=marine sediment metagenome TaxID=412755 RepID=A0A0F9Y1H7_9ZZZZ